MSMFMPGVVSMFIPVSVSMSIFMSVSVSMSLFVFVFIFMHFRLCTPLYAKTKNLQIKSYSDMVCQIMLAA
jgi:hypothetical protein